MEQTKPTETRRKRRLSPWFSIVWLAIMVMLYNFRVDITYALTAWPASLGALIGFFLTFVATRWRQYLVSVWILFALVFVDEAVSVPRMLMPAPVHDFRVVSLNCAGGSVEAMNEVIEQKPDLVLLQESPEGEALRDLSQRMYGAEGSYLKGPDASIVARGKLAPLKLPRTTNDFVAAEWTTNTGQSLKVVSLRLLPPTMRIDLYSPSAWQAFAENRASRRKEVEEIASVLSSLRFTPDIIGGDFNSPRDLDVFHALTNGLNDSFRKAGVGFGATCVNPFPCIVRIDQIWVNRSVKPTRAKVVGTTNSDHKMLVADFTWR